MRVSPESARAEAVAALRASDPVLRGVIDSVGADNVLDPESRLAPDATALEQDLMIAEVIQSALEPVARGLDQLKALRETGVFDAGGYGIIVLVAGIAGALNGEHLEPDPGSRRPPASSS